MKCIVFKSKQGLQGDAGLEVENAGGAAFACYFQKVG